MVHRVAEAYGVRPKSAINATAIYYHHRAALEYDFRARFGFGVEKIDGEELTYQELTALVDGLLNDHSSHTFASVAGWSYVPTPEEVAFYDGLDVKLAMNRGKNQPRPKRVERPWEKPRRDAITAHDPERAKRRAKLNALLGIPT